MVLSVLSPIPEDSIVQNQKKLTEKEQQKINDLEKILHSKDYKTLGERVDEIRKSINPSILKFSNKDKEKILIEIKKPKGYYKSIDRIKNGREETNKKKYIKLGGKTSKKKSKKNKTRKSKSKNAV
jgi:hypothetical protein